MLGRIRRNPVHRRLIAIHLAAFLLLFFPVISSGIPEGDWNRTLGSSDVNLEWQKCIGGSDSDIAYSIQPTTDYGYIMVGGTRSNDGDVSGNHYVGLSDFWVVKLDAVGSMQWQKCLGGSGEDYASSVQQTMDGGYIVAGYTGMNGGDVSGHHGYSDAWVVKLDAVGSMQWQKCLGGSGMDHAYSIQQTADGGYVVAGDTDSNDGDVSGNHLGLYGNPSPDFWIVKLDSIGAIQWQKCLGGSSFDFARSIQQTADGGYIVAGYTVSNDGDVSGYHGGYDFWVVKLDAVGSMQWQKCLGSSDLDYAYSIRQTNDGGYILTGDSNYDKVFKLDSGGNIQWQKNVDGMQRSIQQTSDGGYIVAGRNDAIGSGDVWISRLDSSGTILDQANFGGTRLDGANCIQQTTGGSYIIAGGTGSNDGDVSGNHGGSDAWVVKLTGSANSSIGDLVWNDVNQNGIRDNNEIGLAGVIVRLYRSGKIFPEKVTRTLSNGAYLFTDIPTDDYFIEFVLPSGYVFTKMDQGANDNEDSDADAYTGKTVIFKLNPGENALSWDAGAYYRSAFSNQEAYALLVGIDKGDLEGRPLNSANGINELLLETFSYKPENIKRLLNSDETSYSSIINSYGSFCRNSENGKNFLFYYHAGHGSKMSIFNENIKFQDGYIDDKNWIGGPLQTSLAKTFDNIKNIAFIFDSCHSGGLAEKTDESKFPQALDWGGISGEDKIIMMSSRSENIAYPNPYWNNFIFTKYFLDAFCSGRNCANNLGKDSSRISIQEAYNYAYSKCLKSVYYNYVLTKKMEDCKNCNCGIIGIKNGVKYCGKKVNNYPVISDSFEKEKYFSDYDNFPLWWVKTYSPVHLHAYDDHGNHTGFINDSSYENRIPKSYYSGPIGDEMIIFFAPNILDKITLEIDAFDVGTFDLVLGQYTNGKTTSMAFRNVSINKDSKAYINISHISIDV